MKITQLIKVSTLSALALSILTACGGGSNHDFFTGRTQTETTVGEYTLDKSGNLTPVGNAQPMDSLTFMTTLEDKKSSLNTKGQQNFAIVASVDNNKSRKVDLGDQINWKQSGVISAICAGSACSARDSYDKSIDAAYAGPIAAATDDAAIKAALEAERDSLKMSDGAVYMLDTNGAYHTILESGTIDYASSNNNFIKYDVGAVKVTGQVENGNITAKNGEFDRAYSGVTVFKALGSASGQPTSSGQAASYLNGYLRDASSLGMSYNTFGVFGGDDAIAATRGINYAYQSVGVITQDMPTAGKAEYNGKSHAYLNDKQVTMDVKLAADFASRNITFNSNNAVIHDIAANKHTIEYNNGYALAGNGTWANGSSQYTGDITSSNGLTGKFEGRFYGPKADEVGGVYGLQNNDGSTQMVGGFAARRN